MATTRLLGHDAAHELPAAAGPLPWLPGIPDDLQAYGDWSTYLRARADRVASLGDRVRHNAELPESLARFGDVLTPDLRAEVVVWRAANGVSEDDRSLLGPRVNDPAALFYARRLQRRINDLYPPAVQRWEERMAKSIGRPELRGTHVLDLARDLDGLDRGGMNAGLLDAAPRRAYGRGTRLPGAADGYPAAPGRRSAATSGAHAPGGRSRTLKKWASWSPSITRCISSAGVTWQVGC
jgi:hypothetical protein